MQRILMIGVGALVALGAVACTGSEPRGRAASAGAADSAAGSLAAGSLAAGTTIQATIQDSVSSRTSRAGARVNAIVSRNVLDAAGRVVIPGGATVVLTISRLLAPAADATTDGVVALEVASMTTGATTYRPEATVSPVPHRLVGRATSAERDLVVTAGTPLLFTLTRSLKISAN